MSRTEAPTVKTGGEMGQILDHLLCASDGRIRRKDAQDALKLHGQVIDKLDAALAENARLTRRVNTLELVLITATHDFKAAMQYNDKEKKNA